MINLNRFQIKDLLKIEAPFLMIDKIHDLRNGVSAIGIKEIQADEWFYNCHFLNMPVMPGTLQTEAMLQTTVLIYCYQKKIHPNDCLVNKVSTNHISSISGEGRIEIFSSITQSNNLIIEGKSKIMFKKKKVCEGTFRFINPRKFFLKT